MKAGVAAVKNIAARCVEMLRAACARKYIQWEFTTVEKIALILLMGFGAYLRFDKLSLWTIGGDDAIHMIFAYHGSLWAAFVNVTLHEMHPALSYLILYTLYTHISPAVWVLRLVATIPGFLLMPASYILGRATIGRVGALFLLGAVAFSPTCITQSENMRSYAMCQLFLVMGVLGAYYYIQKPERRWLVLYYVSMVLAIFSEYSAALGVGAAGMTVLYFLWEKHRKLDKEIIRFVIGNALMALFWAVQIILYIHTTGNEGPKVLGYTDSGFIESLKDVPDVLQRGTSGFLMVMRNPLYHAFAGLSLVAFLWLWRKREKFLICLVTFAFVFGLIASVTKGYPMIETRHGMWLMVFSYLPAAYLLEWVVRRYGALPVVKPAVWVAIALIIVSNGLFLDKRFFDPDFYRRDAREYGVFIELEMHEKDFFGALEFIRQHVEKDKDWILTNVADNQRLYYYTTINPLFKREDFYIQRFVCSSWHVLRASQIGRCLETAYTLYKEPGHEKERERMGRNVYKSRHVYTLTNNINNLDGVEEYLDPSLPVYTSPTAAVFGLNEKSRQQLLLPEYKPVNEKQKGQ